MKKRVVGGVQCEICQRTISSKYKLAAHMKVHIGIKSNVCIFCNKTFIYLQNLRCHIQTHLNERAYKCSQCPASFRQRSVLNSHENRHIIRERPRSHFCDLCEKCFLTIGELRTHIGSHLGEKPYKCVSCGKRYRSNIGLKHHRQRSHGVGEEHPYEFDICQKKFASTFNYHMNAHDGKKQFICGICGKYFNINAALVSHMRVHTREKPYKCSQCPSAFSDSNTLRKHVRYVHNGEKRQKQHSCLFCKWEVETLEHLNNHLRRHTHEKPYFCLECDACFVQLGGLQRHKFSHSGAKPFSCSDCLKSYRRKDHLLHHVRVMHENSDVRRFCCTFCGQAFTRNGYLESHMRIHTNERPFQCSKCPLAFARSDSRKNHVKRKHNGEKRKKELLFVFVTGPGVPLPHSTRLLSRHFNKRQYFFIVAKLELKLQKLVQTGIKDCSKSYTRRNHLETHFRKVHQHQ